MSNFHVVQKVKFKNPLLSANLNEKFSFAIDNKATYYILQDNYDIKSKINISKDSDAGAHYFSHTFSTSKEAASITHDNKLTVLRLKDKKFVKIYALTHEKKIIFTTFSEDGRYLLSGSFDSKVYLVDLHTKTIRYRFKNRPDFCSFMCVSQNNGFVFVGYFNTENILLNLKDDSIKAFKLKSPIECALFFDEDKKLFLSDREGNSIIYDCQTFEAIDTKVLFSQWVSTAVLAPNKKYIIVGTRKNHLYLLDPYKNELVSTLDLEHRGTTALAVCDTHLQISFANSVLQKIDLDYLKEEFLIQVGLKQYHKAKKILDDNNFLYIDDAINSFKEGYAGALQKAKSYIAKKLYDEALKITAPFMVFDEYKKELDMLFMQQDYIGEFVQLCQEKDIFNAYLIAQKYPIIQSLHMYEMLEKQFNTTFLKAKKAIEDDPLRGVAVAKQILSPYEKIPAKSEVVKQLLANTQKFTEAQELIKAQNFRGYFQLIGKYNFLRHTLLYEKVQTLATSIYISAQEEYSAKKYIEAKKIFIKLLAFDEYKKDAHLQIEKIDQLSKLEELIENDAKDQIYQLTAQNPFLTFTDSFKHYNQKFEEQMKLAAFHIKSKKIDLALKTLHSYIDISPLYKRIDNCIKPAYLDEVVNHSQEFNVKKYLAQYNYLFGLDEELEAVFNKIGKGKEYQHFKKNPQQIEIARYPKTLL
ncbi:MAG: hypothetical protein ACQESH_09005 [Campylobacterota bacterium]